MFSSQPYHPLKYLVLLLFSLIGMVYHAQTKEDLATMRQYILESMTENRIENQQLFQYYKNLAPEEVVFLKIRSEMLQGNYEDAVAHFFKLSATADTRKTHEFFFMYHWMGYQLAEKLGIKSESDRCLKKFNRPEYLPFRNLQFEFSLDRSSYGYLDAVEQQKLFSTLADTYAKNRNIFQLSRTYFFMGNNSLSRGDLKNSAVFFLKSGQIASQNSDFSVLPFYGIAGRVACLNREKRYVESYSMLPADLSVIGKIPDLALRKIMLHHYVVSSANTGNIEKTKAANAMLLECIQADEDARNKGKALFVSLTEQKNAQLLARQKEGWKKVLYIIPLCFVVAVLGFYFRFRKIREPKHNIPEKSEEESESRNFVVPDKTEARLLHQLENFEANQRYTASNINLKSLAAELDTNPRYLSEIINRHKNVNFSTYINELRIHYIVSKLREDPEYRKFKVSYLAEECGFSSHSLFTTVFKNTMGFSPIEFIRNLNDDE